MSCTCKHTSTSAGQFVCLCDQFIHPAPLNIGAGLEDLPRQIAGFPEFRQAMLFDLRKKAPLDFWRARGEDDLGIMLLEMWAYVCDVLSFYDKTIAQEAYLGTAIQQPSLRRLVALLGYLPRPAVASTVSLAALADGRAPITLPAGTAFRSGGFEGNPAQVFELDEDVVIHPLTNRWNISAPRNENIYPDTSFLLLVELQATILPGTQLLLVNKNDSEKTQTLQVKKVSPYQGKDKRRYTKIEFELDIELTEKTPLDEFQLMIPNQSAALWTGTDINVISDTSITLDSLYKQISASDPILVEKNKKETRWFKITAVQDVSHPLGTNVLFTTKLTLDADINEEGRKSSTSNWGNIDKTTFRVHYNLTPVGEIVNEAKTTLTSSDPLLFESQIETPIDEHNPTRFFFTDKNIRGEALKGKVNFEEAILHLEQGEGWTDELTLPVEVLGNTIFASRGERVFNEILGSGNANLSNQTFKLKKSPLTYLLSPTAANDQGVQSTLRIYVNDIRWKEVASFFGKKPEDEVYIIRQDDEGDSFISFGDGVRGRRLPTGADNVIGFYRHGAGQASPPAGSITQIETPVSGLGSIRNPISASGGADAEGPESLRTYAPKSALILGRAVSIQDMEAVVLSIPGVRAANSKWRWDGIQQRAVVFISYLGEVGIEEKISHRLRNISDPTTPIRIEYAQALPITLVIDISINLRFVEKKVLATVRERLTNLEDGILAPENIGIGKPLFRSIIFQEILSVEGTSGVQSILWNRAAFDEPGKRPGPGQYFDFEQGTLLLNGLS